MQQNVFVLIDVRSALPNEWELKSWEIFLIKSRTFGSATGTMYQEAHNRSFHKSNVILIIIIIMIKPRHCSISNLISETFRFVHLKPTCLKVWSILTHCWGTVHELLLAGSTFSKCRPLFQFRRDFSTSFTCVNIHHKPILSENYCRRNYEVA